MGKSAYELACDNGFEGTLQDYLDSLHGRDGKSAYELACEHGFRGSVKQWLRSLYGGGTGGVVVGVSDHERQRNLLGGNDTGHYHLTKEQYEWLLDHMAPHIRSGQEIEVIKGEEVLYAVQARGVRSHADTDNSG